MIDLHCHLDGSLSVTDLLTLSDMTGVSLPTRDRETLFSLSTYTGVGTLNDYLRKFDLPISLLRAPECVEYAVVSLSRRLAACGCTYAEIRFAPAFHTHGGSSMREIVRGAEAGCKRAEIHVSLILCAMRGREEKENLEVIEIAAEEKGRGVVGVDLAGAEALYPTEGYREVFLLASRLGLNITVHAGEAAGADSVRAALDLGARRIGHGVRAAGDEALLDRIAREGIVLEMCPTSNVQTGAVASIETHPIGDFMARGIRCVVCSDNMTVSNTDVRRECALVKQAFPVLAGRIGTDEDMKYAFGRTMK
ncbi:MAG: adenosine deaminase [Clostridia bacterium]|nr:adenosine deaminase [Clostridia bacterium]